jgi:hypothetical protein
MQSDERVVLPPRESAVAAAGGNISKKKVQIFLLQNMWIPHCLNNWLADGGEVVTLL